MDIFAALLKVIVLLEEPDTGLPKILDTPHWFTIGEWCGEWSENTLCSG
jgi:hypothetical protein